MDKSQGFKLERFGENVLEDSLPVPTTEKSAILGTAAEEDEAAEPPAEN
jgi:hypothetical protein